MYPGYTLLLWPRVYIAGGYLYHNYTLCTLNTHCYDGHWYTLVVLIYITIPYVLWIHIVMMTLCILCWCLSISLLYLMYPGYTLLWWPCVYIAGVYLYHYTLCTLDTHCYREGSGSVVECLTRDWRAGVRASQASLRCGPWARHIYPSLVQVQPRKTRPA